LFTHLRLLIISFYCYTTHPQGAGHVDWRMALAIFYSHVLVCFLLNLVLNDCDPKVFQDILAPWLVSQSKG
jgi:hypothetical protein